MAGARPTGEIECISPKQSRVISLTRCRGQRSPAHDPSRQHLTIFAVDRSPAACAIIISLTSHRRDFSDDSLTCVTVLIRGPLSGPQKISSHQGAQRSIETGTVVASAMDFRTHPLAEDLAVALCGLCVPRATGGIPRGPGHLLRGPRHWDIVIRILKTSTRSLCLSGHTGWRTQRGPSTPPCRERNLNLAPCLCREFNRKDTHEASSRG